MIRYLFPTVLALLFFGHTNTAKFQEQKGGISTDSMPRLPEPPSGKKGWIGQYMYTLRIQGKGNAPKPYSYAINQFRIHTGYVELTRLVRGAIKTNQPDRYNEKRWESWLPEGSKKSWSYINDSLYEVTVITADPCCLAPHDHFVYTTAGSPDNLQVGATHNYNLQIDRLTGTFILSQPLCRLPVSIHEIWKLNKQAAKKANYLRDVDEVRSEEVKTYQYFNDQDTLMGKVSAGQKEIFLQRRGPLTYRSFLYTKPNGSNLFITPFARGEVVFQLRLYLVE